MKFNFLQKISYTCILYSNLKNLWFSFQNWIRNSEHGDGEHNKLIMFKMTHEKIRFLIKRPFAFEYFNHLH